MSEWRDLVGRMKNLTKKVKIALVGKYVELHDAYLSVAEALFHGGVANDAEVEIDWLSSEELTEENVDEWLQGADGILVPTRDTLERLYYQVGCSKDKAPASSCHLWLQSFFAQA